MSPGYAHLHREPAKGRPQHGALRRLMIRAGALLGFAPVATGQRGLPELPLGLRRGELATRYLDAERAEDHRRAGAAAASAMDRAAATGNWWHADVWGHRALWHFEQAGMALQSARQARRIGESRAAAGDPEGARRYYAEAIDEARDIGAEHEQGLAALGLGHALLQIGDATGSRRLAAAAVVLLDRAGASPAELGEARRLQGAEVPVGEHVKEIG